MTATIDVPAEVVAAHHAVVAFKVVGDCMNGDGILDGDYVLVDPYARVQDGDIAAVWINGSGLMIKHVYHWGKAVRLVASNPAYQPFVRPRENVVIVGRVIGRQRLLE